MQHQRGNDPTALLPFDRADDQEGTPLYNTGFIEGEFEPMGASYVESGPCKITSEQTSAMQRLRV